MSKVKLLIATPMYAGQCTMVYTRSMIVASAVLSQREDIDFDFVFLGNESLIPRARNLMVHGFLQRDFTHLMFIDADIEFGVNSIIDMLREDVDLIGGVYPAKGLNWEAIAAAAQAGVPADKLKYYGAQMVIDPVGDGKGQVIVDDPSKPIEVKHVGTGFMLIKRKVFELMAPYVPKYVNTDDGGKTEIHEFFGMSIDEDTNILLSEDYDFCQKWRWLDGKVYAAPYVALAHFGSYRFEGPFG